jgi:hypothetical protein
MCSEEQDGGSCVIKKSCVAIPYSAAAEAQMERQRCGLPRIQGCRFFLWVWKEYCPFQRGCLVACEANNARGWYSLFIVSRPLFSMDPFTFT